jgi:hypothetical protein
LKYGDDSDLFDTEEGVEYATIPEGTDYKTLMREKLFPTGVEKVLFDPSGKFLLAVSGDGNAFVIECFKEFKIIGRVEYSGDFKGATWNFEGKGDTMVCKRVNECLGPSFLHNGDKGIIKLLIHSQVHSHYSWRPID